MKESVYLRSPDAATAIQCDVLAFAAVRIPADQIPSFRQQPGPGSKEFTSATFLKQSDEQTIAGLSAVFQAIHDHELDGTRFGEWGVVAAPRFLGRGALAAALERYATEGAWGVSPHLVPHRSLHSLSGTISQALKIRGPNCGIGGGPASETEALLFASAWISDEHLPGVWVIMTDWEPEFVPARNSSPAASSACRGLALALVNAQPNGQGWRMNITPDAKARKSEGDELAFGKLFDFFAGDCYRIKKKSWSLAAWGHLELKHIEAKSGSNGLVRSVVGAENLL